MGLSLLHFFHPSHFIFRVGGYTKRTVFIVMSLFCGIVVLIGWGIPAVITVVCKSTWGHGWRTLFAITSDIRVTLRTLHRRSSYRSAISSGEQMEIPGVSGQHGFPVTFDSILRNCVTITTGVTRNGE